MFFAQLNKAAGGSKDPRHPQNNSQANKTVYKDAPKRPRPQKSETPKKKRMTSSKSGSPKESPKSGVASPRTDSREASASLTAPPVIDSQRTVFASLSYDDGQQASSRVCSGAALVHKSPKLYKPLFDSAEDSVTLSLPYGTEEYNLVYPKAEDEYSPNVEIESVMEMVAGYFVSPEHGLEIKDPDMKDCIVRRLRRALKAGDKGKYTQSIGEFNSLLEKARESGEVEASIKKITSPLEAKLVTALLNQVYTRIVSPRANDLRNYKAFSNNVYGELLPPFATRIFKQTNLTSESVFVDLGSGVGNCVLQAALEIGCESWGCEMMPAASQYASEQQKELEDRAKMYNLNLGPINLLSDDFVQNPDIQKTMKRADVVLVNNYAFDAKLNGNLVDMFLDLKEGAKIVSLKSFVPQDHVISEANIESPLNILSVETKRYPSGHVSWQPNGGVYYISTIDRSRLALAYSRRTPGVNS